MLETWLVPVVLFWGVMALYFGGFERDVQGGSGFRQFLGLILTYAIFLAVWGGLHSVVAAGSTVGVLIASAVAGVAIPLEVRLGFLLVGARVRRSSMAGH
jgi:hypothetical protein